MNEPAVRPMSSRGNDPQKSADSESEAAEATFEIVDVTPAKKKWVLSLHPSHLALREPTETQPYILLRQGFPKDFNYLPGLRALAINKPVKTSLKLDPAAGEAFMNWIGKGTMAGLFLRRRYGFILPLALIWMVTALPLPGNSSSGLAGKPFDIVAFGLGTFLVAAWVWARWRPSPVLFLLDAFWFGCLAARVAWQISQGRTRWLYLVVGLGVLMTITGVQHFFRFRNTSIPRWKGW